MLNFKPLWSENLPYGIGALDSIEIDFMTQQSILKNFLCALEKDVYSTCVLCRFCELHYVKLVDSVFQISYIFNDFFFLRGVSFLLTVCFGQVLLLQNCFL